MGLIDRLTESGDIILSGTVYGDGGVAFVLDTEEMLAIADQAEEKLRADMARAGVARVAIQPQFPES